MKQTKIFGKSALFGRYDKFFEQLARLYADMDRGYDEAAAGYGFKCNGCRDSCCLTRFYHYTHIEYLYLLYGFFQLEAGLQERIRACAEKAVLQVGRMDAVGQTPRVMCPLNLKGRCILYAYRPMICRLHGIPHEFVLPGGKTVLGTGCPEFARRCGDRAYRVFDRTPFYSQMAALEQRFRAMFDFPQGFKKTISEMLVATDFEHRAGLS